MSLKSQTSRKHSTRSHSWVFRASIGALLGALALAGCEKPKTSDKGGKPGEAGEKKPGHGGEAAGGEHQHAERADEVKLTPEAIRSNRIRIATAETKILESTFTAPARVAFNMERVAHVGSILKGRVADMKVRKGETVTTGTPMLVIDSPELGEAQSEYIQKLVAVEVAKPATELAKGAYGRAQQLFDKTQGISLSELQKRLGEYQTAQGALGAATAALTAAENRLQLLGMTAETIQTVAKTRQLNSKYTIVAPIDGQVIERETTLGELVAPEKERLITLADLSTVWVFADIPEGRLWELQQGAKASVTVAALQSDPIQGVVAQILPQLDATTRTARVRIDIKNEKMNLRPGMFATAEITTGTAEGVVAIPETAVQTVEGEPAIFVPHEKEENTFLKRQIGAGPAVKGFVPVFAGLKAGEKYVAAGSFILKAEIGKQGAAHEH